MISYERREVAARIKALPDDMYTRSLELLNDGILDLRAQDTADYYEIYYALFGAFPANNQHLNDFEELHKRLADLIDPTCEFEDRAFWNGRYAYGYTCSRCLAKFGEDTADQWFYCPNCGARVVADDD